MGASMNASMSSVYSVPDGRGSEYAMIGESMPMKALRKVIDRVVRVANMASTNTPVMITGDTGTGKELVARLIHQRSHRANRPFVAVNCAALPEGLFHSEIFGHVKGAFTNALCNKTGRIEAARGGTLFLDEIGDLSPDVQVVLLRFLEEGVYERLGSSTPVRADVCIMSATHTDLEEACAQGRFREDLYYRLNAFRVRTPPLRDRGDDIVMIAQYFIDMLSNQLGLREHSLEPEVEAKLRAHDWPGNVRELRNRILQALVMSESNLLTARNLGLESVTECPSKPDSPTALSSLYEYRRSAEHMAIRNTLEVTGGDVEAAAVRLGISRAQLYRLIKDHDLNAGSS